MLLTACFLQRLKGRSSLLSSMDSRVVGHNLIKHHICSDTVCPVRSFPHAHHSMYCESVAKHTWLWYLPAVIEHDQSPQTGAELPSQHNEVICSFMCALCKTLTHTDITNAGLTSVCITLCHLNYILNKPKKEIRQQEEHSRL